MSASDTDARRLPPLNALLARSVVQRIRFLANFFDAGSTAIKSGTAGQAVTLGLVENNT